VKTFMVGSGGWMEVGGGCKDRMLLAQPEKDMRVVRWGGWWGAAPVGKPT
jgi:hypothetical protein